MDTQAGYVIGDNGKPVCPGVVCRCSEGFCAMHGTDPKPEQGSWKCPCCDSHNCDGYCSVDRFDGSGGFDR